MPRVMDPGSPLRAVRLATVAAIVAMMVVVAGSPARACSCAIDGVKAAISRSDGAFVGRWVDRADVGNGYAAVTFEVERVVKGSFGPKAIVRTNTQASACGLEMLGPARTGLLMKAPDGVWESNLCSMVKPSLLLAVGGDRSSARPCDRSGERRMGAGLDPRDRGHGDHRRRCGPLVAQPAASSADGIRLT